MMYSSELHAADLLEILKLKSLQKREYPPEFVPLCGVPKLTKFEIVEVCFKGNDSRDRGPSADPVRGRQCSHSRSSSSIGLSDPENLRYLAPCGSIRSGSGVDCSVDKARLP